MPTIRCTGYLWFVIASVLVCSLAVQDPPSVVAPSGFIVGASTHFSRGKGLLDRNLDLIQGAGVASIIGVRPYLISSDLAGVSMAEVIDRSRQISATGRDIR